MGGPAPSCVRSSCGLLVPLGKVLIEADGRWRRAGSNQPILLRGRPVAGV